MQFAQNAFTSAKLAQKVCKGLFNEGIDSAKGTWAELYADTAKPNRDGTFDQVKLFVGPDQTPEQRSTLFMLKNLLKFVKRFILKTSSHFGKLKVLCRSFGKGRKILSKMLPTSATVDESMVQ